MLPIVSLVPLLGALALTGPQPRPCTKALAAEEGVTFARRSWIELHREYMKYARRMDCDDGAIAEGWSDAVGHLLAEGWTQLPKLSHLTKSDPGFLRFITRHIDLTIPAGELDRIHANAKTRCPRGYDSLCTTVLGALAEVNAEATLDKVAPDIFWRTLLKVDLDGDARVDYAMLGSTESEVVVGVVVGAAAARPAVFRFATDPGSQGGICGAPSNASISVEDLSPPDDEDSPAEARAVAGSRRKGFRLDAGDCDAFHFYFDGRLTWWRR